MGTITILLYEKTRKYTKFTQTNKIEESFIKLKTNLNKKVVNYLPNYKQNFILETDASDSRLNAVLLQANKNGDLGSIRKARKKLTKTNHNYAMTKKNYIKLFGV